MNFSPKEPQILAGLLAAGAIVAAVGYSIFRKKPDPLEIEHQRRLALVRSGRIVDGTLLDIREVSPSESETHDPLKLLIYQYEIGGVTYECSQDVSPLGEHLDLHAIRIGFPCSVKYQPNNPQNSILIAENWSGLRDRDAFIPIEPAPEEAEPGLPA